MGKRTLQLFKPLKEFLCQHIIGMEIKLKFCTSPSTKDMSLGEERKGDSPEKQQHLYYIQ
jgi:hypothetical protein